MCRLSIFCKNNNQEISVYLFVKIRKLMNKKVTFTTQHLIYFLLIVLSFVLYGNSIQNDYGLDDEFVVSGNPYVQKGTAGIQEILEKPYAKVGESTLDRRPVGLITFALEHQYIGDNPHVSHFINILLYALSLIILYKVLIKIFRLDEVHSFLPLLVTVFFAVHPLHTEVVDSLKNREELLVFLFGLLFLLFGYYFFTKERWRWLYAFLGIASWALLISSKISGVIFLPLFILIGIFYTLFKRKIWNYAFVFFCFYMGMAVAQLIFEKLHRTTQFFENPLQDNKDMLIKLGTASKILLYHIKMLLFPWPLHYYYGYNMFPLTSVTHPIAFVSALFHAGLLVYGIIRFYKKDVLGLIILCYFVSIFLYANFPVAYTGMFSERALLLSSLWFIVILGIMIIRLFKSEKPIFKNIVFRNIFSIALVVLFAMYSYMTISRNFLWKNNLTLMSHDIEYMEKSVMGNYMYANNLKWKSKESTDSIESRYLANKALYYYQRTLNLAPNYPEFFFKMASTYRYNLHNLDSAITHFGYAISIDTMYTDAYFELSKIFFDKQEYMKSYYFFGKTYHLQPKDSLTLFYYAQSASNVGDMATCFKINQEFLKLYPELPYPYLNLGTYYSKQLKDDSAVIYLEKAINLGSRSPELLQQMAFYYTKKGNQTKAAYFQGLIK